MANLVKGEWPFFFYSSAKGRRVPPWNGTARLPCPLAILAPDPLPAQAPSPSLSFSCYAPNCLRHPLWVFDATPSQAPSSPIPACLDPNASHTPTPLFMPVLPSRYLFLCFFMSFFYPFFVPLSLSALNQVASPRSYGAVYKGRMKEGNDMIAVKQIPMENDLEDILKEVQ